MMTARTAAAVRALVAAASSPAAAMATGWMTLLEIDQAIATRAMWASSVAFIR